MKFFVVASLAFLSGAYAADSASTTITCSGCPSAVTTPDIVTRSALPTISCSEKPLKVVTIATGASSGVAAPTGSGSGSGSGSASTPSAVPVSGASGNKMGGAGMAVAAAVAAVYLL